MQDNQKNILIVILITFWTKLPILVEIQQPDVYWTDNRNKYLVVWPPKRKTRKVGMDASQVTKKSIW